MGILGVGTSLLGMAVQEGRANKQHSRQRELMDTQMQNQWKLNNQGHQLQLDMWKKTNYPAQMEMLKEAGLNPALLYGQSGAGGSTTGSQGGGSAQGGQAHAPMDIGGAVQMGMMASQMKVNEASAEKMKAEADNIRGEEGTIGAEQIKKIIAETTTENYKQNVLRAEEGLKESLNTKAIYDANKTEEERHQLRLNRDNNIKLVEQELLNKVIDIEVKQQGINLSKDQQTKIWHEIRQQWVQAGLKGLDVIAKGVIAKNLGKKQELKSSQTDYNNGNTTYKNYK